MYFKQCLLLITIVCAMTSGKQVSIKVTPEKVFALRDVSKKCAEETGVDSGILAKLINWTLDDDEPSKTYTYCLALHYGFINTDSTLNMAKILENEIVKGTKEEYIEIIKECDKVKKDRKIDTVFEKGNCLNKSVEYIVIRPSN